MEEEVDKKAQARHVWGRSGDATKAIRPQYHTLEAAVNHKHAKYDMFLLTAQRQCPPRKEVTYVTLPRDGIWPRAIPTLHCVAARLDPPVNPAAFLIYSFSRIC